MAHWESQIVNQIGTVKTLAIDEFHKAFRCSNFGIGDDFVVWVVFVKILYSEALHKDTVSNRFFGFNDFEPDLFQYEYEYLFTNVLIIAN